MFTCSLVYNDFALKNKELITLLVNTPSLWIPHIFLKPICEIPESGESVVSTKCSVLFKVLKQYSNLQSIQSTETIHK